MLRRLHPNSNTFNRVSFARFVTQTARCFVHSSGNHHVDSIVDDLAFTRKKLETKLVTVFDSSVLPPQQKEAYHTEISHLLKRLSDNTKTLKMCLREKHSRETSQRIHEELCR